MEELDFNPSKSTKKFQRNYKLHDLAEHTGKNLLTQWGISFKDFGDDRRYEKVWEKGSDKPDTLISYRDKSVFVDWKGKRKNLFIVNKRAVKSYEEWASKLKFKVIICFFIFNDELKIVDRRFAIIGNHPYIESSRRQWDKNVTVEFRGELPKFTKEKFVKELFIN